MYEIARNGGRVIITQGDRDKPVVVFNASQDAYVMYTKDSGQRVTKVKDLPDEELLLALANAIHLKS